MITIGADHGGYRLKESLKVRLRKAGYRVHDVGAQAHDPKDDYPVFAERLGRIVAKKRTARGILICRNGVGVCIAANKVRGVRAVTAADRWTASRSRTDDDTNVLCLGADRLTGTQAWAIVQKWLSGKFRNADRDRRRLRQIWTIERG